MEYSFHKMHLTPNSIAYKKNYLTIYVKTQMK